MTQQQVQQWPNEPANKPGDTQNSERIGNGILRRNNKGCKSKDFYNWPEQLFDDMDSPLAVQQYIQQLIYKDPSDVDEILRLPKGQDLGAWKIEHLRLFCMQLNRLTTKLQECCHPETCNQMTATEQWIFLCAAHKQPNECSAIDYTRHTLDGAASLLNSNKYFPSRVTIKESSVAKLGSVCRRVYRIFSHAYYHHFQVFDDFERETHLCRRFSKFVTNYDLMSKDTLIVPSDGTKPVPDPNLSTKSDTSADADTTKLETTSSKPEAAENADPKEAVKPQDNVKSDINQKAAPHIETKTKKSSDDPPSKPAVIRQPWSSSTNTMVKGASGGSPKVTNLDKSLTKSTSLENSSSTSGSAAKGRGTTLAKNGVESEA